MAEPIPEKEIGRAYELPEEWVWTTIGEICSKPQYGWTASANPNGDGLKLLRTTDISAGHVNWSTVPASSKLPDNPDKYNLKPGDIVVSRAGSVGISIEITECPDAIFASYLIRFNAISPIPPRYISLFLKTPYYWSSIVNNTAGIAIPNVNATKLANLEIPLPPLAEQHRIVAKLEALLAQVNAAKDHLAAVPPIIKRFRQSVLAAACSGRLTEDWRREHPDVEPARKLIGEILQRRLSQANTPTKKQKIKDIYSHREEQDSDLLPRSWEYVTLGKLCESFQYGSSKKSMPEGKIPVLRMGNIQNREIDWNNLVYTSDEWEIEKYRLEPGTVLFNRTNSPELVGKTAIYRGERPAIFAGYLIKINNYKELNSEYLNYCLNTTYTKEQCLKVRTDGVSQSNINAQKLGKFKIPFCPLEEQEEIVRHINTLFKVINSIEYHYKKANAQIDNLTQSILAKAFRGELVPQDPDDEPASVLLERISKERTELEKKPQKRRSKTLPDSS